jgi:3-oxoacyl-[acyl-carrier-protein] synthase I
VTSIGNDRSSVSDSLRGLKSGIETHEFIPAHDVPVRVFGTIKGFDVTALQWAGWTWPSGYAFPREVLRGMAPHGLYALCAVEQALAVGRLGPAELNAEDTGLFCASVGSPRLMRQFLNQIHDSGGGRIAPMGVVSTIAGTLNFNLAAHLGIRGAVAGFVSACTSSTHALGYAHDEIRLGRLKRVLVVGGEDAAMETTYPFHGMRALSRNPDPVRASRPFDRDRDGFVGTGGSVALVLEDAESAHARGAPIYAEMLGWGQSADGQSISGSDPSGRGLASAMLRAMAQSGVQPAEIGYVNAHATSTPLGDASEARALRTVFTESGLRPRVSSTKALTGHGLSLSGIMETAFCALSLAEGFVPGMANLENPDPVCEGLNFPRATLQESPGIVLKNSSGFGGSNVCVVLRKWND